MMNTEHWRAIPSRPGYEASTLGRIRSWCWTRNRYVSKTADEPIIKRAYKNENGYLIVHTGHDKKDRAHVLVAEAFLGTKPEKMDVNHKDGNKQNNRPSNLEYITRSDNHKHAYRLGLSTSPFTGRVGEKHFLAKISDSDVIAIRESYANDVSRRSLADQYGLSYYTVWDITARRSWRHL